MADKEKVGTDTAIEVHNKEFSEKLISMINELGDELANAKIKFTTMIKEIYDRGTSEGFTWDEITERIRPYLHQRKLGKDQIYYVTHQIQMQEKNKLRYEARNLPLENRINASIEGEQEVLPKDVQKLVEIKTEEITDSAQVSSELTSDQLQQGPTTTYELEPIHPASATIAVQDFSLNDLEKYDNYFLIQIVRHLSSKLEQSEQQLKEHRDNLEEVQKLFLESRKYTDAELGKAVEESMKGYFSDSSHLKSSVELKPKSKPKSKKSKSSKNPNTKGKGK